MRTMISDSELRKLSREKDTAGLRRLLDATRRAPNGDVSALDEKIRAFETKFGMPSDEMLRRVEANEAKETWEVCQWLMAYRLRRDVYELRP